MIRRPVRSKIQPFPKKTGSLDTFAEITNIVQSLRGLEETWKKKITSAEEREQQQKDIQRGERGPIGPRGFSVKGDKGEAPKPEVVAEILLPKVLDLIPPPKPTPEVDVEAIKALVIAELPPQVPQPIFDEKKVMSLVNKKKLKATEVEGMTGLIEDTMRRFGLPHGGGDTVSAGSGITITVDPTSGNKVISNNGGGAGDVDGPASAVADNIAVFDGVTGKLIKDGGVTISSLQKNIYVTVGTSDADYITDGVADDVQIQAAIDYVSGQGGGTVFIKTGTYTLGAIVNMASNVWLRGQGYSTKIIISSNYTFKVSSKSNVRLTDLHLDGALQSSGNYYGFYVENSTDIYIERNYMENMHGFSVHVTAYGGFTTKNVWITENYLQGVGYADTIGGGGERNTGSLVKDVFIENNIVIQDFTPISHGTDITAINFVGVDGIRFVNNITYGGMLFGIEQYPSEDSMISGNTVKPPVGGTEAAIGFILNTLSPTSARLIISNNTVTNGFIDVLCQSTNKVDGVQIIGNTVDADGTTLGIGIYSANLNKTNISGNTIVNASVEGMRLDKTTYSSISSNVVANCGVGILEKSSGTDYNQIVNNLITGSTVSNYVIIGTHDTLITSDNANGFVGINVNDPSRRLHIVDNLNGEILRLESSGDQSWMSWFKGAVMKGILGFGSAGNIFNSALTDSMGLRAAGALHLGSGANIALTVATTNNFGVGLTNPTALLHIKAGTATASTAPIKLTSGTLLTVPEAGAVEFLNDKFYGTTTTGPTRQTFATLESTINNEVVSGSGTSFTLASTPIVGSVKVYAGRNRLYPTTDYSITGASITTVLSWATGDLLADYQI